MTAINSKRTRMTNAEKLTFLATYIGSPFQVGDLSLIGATDVLPWSHDEYGLSCYQLCQEIRKHPKAFKEALYRDSRSKKPILRRLKKGIYAPADWKGSGEDACKAIYVRLRPPNAHPVSYVRKDEEGKLIVYDAFEKTRGRKVTILGYAFTLKGISYLLPKKAYLLRKGFYQRQYFFPSAVSKLVVPDCLREYQKIVAGKETYSGIREWFAKYHEKRGNTMDEEMFFTNPITKAMTPRAKKKLAAFREEAEL
jgi:hypothetical protein